MTSLPIVERELRVSSRKHFTYWSRLAAAGFLMLIFGLMFTVLSLGGRFPWSPGKVIFWVMNWTTFVFVAAWGVFLPSDAVSEEKREGTLGLLFLTDLRGYDIVLGKLARLLLQSLYTLLAVLPVLALPLMMGGVSGAEFGRTALVMANMLFFALCIGLFVSSISREVLKAMNAALLINAIFFFGLLLADLWRAHWNPTKWERFYSIASPLYLFSTAAGLRPKDFWPCLIVQHCIAWVFLAGACLAVPRAWQERTQSGAGFWRSLFSRFRLGGKRKRLALRRKWMERSPILWLLSRDRWLPRQIWIVTVMAIGFLVWDFARRWLELQVNQHNPGRRGPLFSGPLDLTYLMEGFSPVSHMLEFALIVWVAMQACRFYAEATGSGAMELILVTPISIREIVRSHWKALCRTFLFTAMVVLGLRMAGAAGTWFDVWQGNQLRQRHGWLEQEFVDHVSGWVNVLMRLLAVGWFGMWMGLTSRKVSAAVIKTIAFVCLLPLLVELFVWIGFNALEQYMAFKKFPSPPAWVWFLPVPMFEFAKNIIFIVSARIHVMRRFRDLVAQSERRPKARLNVLPSSAPPPILTRPLVS